MTTGEQTAVRDRDVELLERVAEVSAALRREVGKRIVGQHHVVDGLLTALLANGHALLVGVPGLAKTLLVSTVAEVLDLDFSRIQFTPDLMPTDITGTEVIEEDRSTGRRVFRFVKGPIFANVVLADEINRATPKTQSALLEAMSEGQVSVDRERYVLPRPFLVLATQNPLEHQGTYPLPESQLDRFLMSLEIGYPPRREERELLLSGGVDELLAKLPAVVDGSELVALQEEAPRVRVAEKLADYMLEIAEATRASAEFRMGVSTRGVQGLYRATQALALYEGRGYAIPDDVQRLAVAVLAHRVALRRQGATADEARRAIERVVAGIPVPL
jgi:MoxR-like ATPase